MLDARLGLLAAGVAAVSSERVRKTVGKGLGYAATGAVAVGGPVARPVMDAGRDILHEARAVAGNSSASATRSSRSRTSSSR